VNLAYQDIKHNLGRFLLTCVGLSLLLGVVLSMIGIYRGLVADALTLVSTPKADIWIVEEGSRGPFAESSRIPAETQEAIARIYGVKESGAITYQSTEIFHKNRKLRLYIVGFEPLHIGGVEKIVSGRFISKSHYEIIADVKSKLSIGEKIKLGKNIFTVVGLTNDQVSSGGDPVIYMTLKDSQKLQFDLSPSAIRIERAKGTLQKNYSANTVNAVIARIDNNANLLNVVKSIKQWKHLSAMTQQEQEHILVRSVVEKARKQIGMFTALLLIVSAVIIALIIYTMTMDKMKEIATLKLIGAPDKTIIGLIVQQALSMGIIGFGFGALLIVNIKDHFPKRVILQWEDGLMLAFAVLVVCVLSSMLGVRLALKIDPATALGG